MTVFEYIKKMFIRNICETRKPIRQNKNGLEICYCLKNVNFAVVYIKLLNVCVIIILFRKYHFCKFVDI